MNESTCWDINKRKCITRLNIRTRTCCNLVANLKSVRSDDVALLAVSILNKSDVSRAVWVILKSKNCTLYIKLLTLKVDDTIFLTVTAASVANRNSSVAVSA